MNARRFDPLIERLRTSAAQLPDPRTGANTQYSMADLALSAFAVFFTQRPSFLSFQKLMEQNRGANNARSLFQIERLPTDNHIRHCLDPVAPEHLLGFFDDLHRAFDEHGLLEAMRASSPWTAPGISPPNPKMSSARTAPACGTPTAPPTHYHSAITPVIVSPGHSQVVPLRPEFITPQDRQAKQDCEITAAKRWLAAHAARYHTGNDTLLGDDLYAHQPFCRQVLLHGFHFLFTCKPTSHTHLAAWVEGLAAGRALPTLRQRVKGKANRWEHHQYRWANAVPLTDSADALKVNWCEVTITNADGKVKYRNAFITDWEISADNVAGLVTAGRARWKIENEHNNVLKNRGDHLEHNFGHGKKHLVSLLLTLNLLAFGLHTLLELSDEEYRLLRAQLGARRTFFQHLQAVTTYWHFDTWAGLMDFMMRGLEIGPYAVPKS